MAQRGELNPRVGLKTHLQKISLIILIILPRIIPSTQENLKDIIIKSIRSLDQISFRGRQSIYFDNENIRDLIILGFTITYRIKKDQIEVFGLTKYQDNPFD